jgi:rhamnose utilization protein RhaD (predicted bifunctional aldolase and dehydrogenase)
LTDLEMIRRELVDLSRELGEPAHDYVILGEGNTSARVDEQTFLVKASGTELRTLGPDQVLRVGFAACNALIGGPALTDDQIKDGLLAAVVDGPAGVRPSIETLMHAALLQMDGVRFVGHTHPTVVNAIACSGRFGADLTRRLFPDHVVVCGASAALVPYVDPGMPLAHAVVASATDYQQAYGEPPKTLFLKNHGLIALGRSARQAAQVTHMTAKALRILLGTYAAGGPDFMPDAEVARIAGRDDEHYRQAVLDRRRGV